MSKYRVIMGWTPRVAERPMHRAYEVQFEVVYTDQQPYWSTCAWFEESDMGLALATLYAKEASACMPPKVEVEYHDGVLVEST